MKYPLPHGYHFEIVRKPDNENGPMFAARLVSPIEALGVISTTSGESPFEYPTRRVSAGNILYTMLHDTRLQTILGDAYPLIHDKALEMAGIERTAQNENS